MVFSSSLFLLYFLPVFLLVYYFLPKGIKNLFILLFSIFFYAWGAPDFIWIVLVSIIADFYIVRFIARAEGRNRKLLTGLSVVINIGLLAYFKYANFFIGNFNSLISSMGMHPVHWAKVALPIGISFFTFHKITYAVDVYRKVCTPLKKITDYAMYILMFPQLVAGPIVRFNEVAGQIIDREKNETIDNRFTGFFRFVIGLSKKVLIANVLGEEVDRIFALGVNDLTTSLAWIGVIAYAFQIYFDFSGYSDMALGMGKMIGFKFPENFNNPYISQSITEFWRRWHMSLSRFMRDYLYIPLGGNRVSTARMYFNLWVVFLISGLWHGAAWNFIAWGAFHGFFLVADRLFLLKFYEKIGKWPSIMMTFLITLVGWVLFRADTLTHAVNYLGSMFSLDFRPGEIVPGVKFYVILVLAVLFSFQGLIRGMEGWQEKVLSPEQPKRKLVWMTAFSVLFFIISVGAITSTGFNPFIYFRF
jgi:alginate O-acetyltransferase complex protein AlgI